MCTERAALLLMVLAVLPFQARAQDALSRVGGRTQVQSVELRFEDRQSLSGDELRQHLGVTAPGAFAGLGRLLDFLPLVPAPGAHPFDPLELQRDVIRLRNYYRRAGFLHAQVRFEVRYRAGPDRVRVAYVIREGPPLAVRSIAYVSDGGRFTVPASLAGEWSRLVQRERRTAGRLGEAERLALGHSAAIWFRHVGYPFAVAQVAARVDSTADRADVTVQVRPGPRARIRAIEVTGNETIPAHELTRELPVKPGQWYDGTALEQGRRLITQQGVVRLALLDVPRDSFRDSSVVVRLRVAESRPHSLRGDIGLTSGNGVSGHAQWTDRSFAGKLRSLTVAATAQSGVITVGQPSQELYRLRLTLEQPYVADRRVSFVGGPFVEYRDDLRDRSRSLGVDAALVYAAAPLRSISLGYTLSHRLILGYGPSGDLPPVEYFPLLGLADSAAAARLGSVQNRSAVRLEGAYGALDQLADPRRGFVLRPRVEVTTPGGFNTNDYFLCDLSGAAFLPLTRRTGITLRGGGGRIFPFGRGLPVVGVDSPFVSMFRLRDIAFTAGGSRDVRGWGSELLGPKLPEAERQSSGTAPTFANWYRPLGGLARLTASAEVRMPLPGFGEQWQSFAFLDGGRIWTPDSRFAPDLPVIEADRFFAGAGLGVGYQTAVGSVQVALGYKLNPSALDLRAPDDVLQAMAAGRPIESVPASASRRFHIHLAIGATF